LRRSSLRVAVRSGALLATLVVLPAVVASTSAQAADCTARYGSDQLVLDVAALEQAVAATDKEKAITLATSMQRNLPCVEQKLPLAFLARIYRVLGGGFYVGGDTKTGERWFRTAIEIDGTFRYGVEDLPSDHPLRPAYASLLQAKEPEAVAVAGKAFGPDGTWMLDGRRIEGPAARPDRPHLLQREHEAGVQSWLLDGAAFPDAILVAGKNVADAGAKRKKRDRTKYDVDIHQMGQGAVLVDRSQPPEQIPLIVTGSTLIAGGVGLYVGSYVSRRNFNTIRDSEDRLRKSQQTTNRMVLGSLAAIAIGAGTLTYGIVIDDAGNPIGPRIDIRF
jgi:hypothetical protein